jgi:hypothetical protein
VCVHMSYNSDEEDDEISRRMREIASHCLKSKKILEERNALERSLEMSKSQTKVQQSLLTTAMEMDSEEEDEHDRIIKEVVRSFSQEVAQLGAEEQEEEEDDDEGDEKKNIACSFSLLYEPDVVNHFGILNDLICLGIPDPNPNSENTLLLHQLYPQKGNEFEKKCSEIIKKIGKMNPWSSISKRHINSNANRRNSGTAESTNEEALKSVASFLSYFRNFLEKEAKNINCEELANYAIFSMRAFLNFFYKGRICNYGCFHRSIGIGCVDTLVTIIRNVEDDEVFQKLLLKKMKQTFLEKPKKKISDAAIYSVIGFLVRDFFSNFFLDNVRFDISIFCLTEYLNIQRVNHVNNDFLLKIFTIWIKSIQTKIRSHHSKANEQIERELRTLFSLLPLIEYIVNRTDWEKPQAFKISTSIEEMKSRTYTRTKFQSMISKLDGIEELLLLRYPPDIFDFN